MEIIITGILAFASTNIDDIFILMLFFGDKDYKAKHVIMGQYLGIIILIAISFLGSFIGVLIDPKYIGLLGFLPIYLGIRGLLQLRTFRHQEQNEKEYTKKSNTTFTVAAVTFSNGGDNLGIYIPLLATLSTLEKSLLVLIFLIMVAVWCLAAKYLNKHPMIAKVIQRFGHIITPVVLILLGIYILYDSSFKLFL
jgi:cadmium resistance transport/sequestration family protein